MSIFDRLSKKLFSADREISTLQKQLSEQLRQQLADCPGTPAPFAGQLETRLRSLLESSRPKEDSEQPLPTDGALEVALSGDRMTAYVCVFPPVFNGKAITLDAAQQTLQQAGVTYGVDTTALQNALADCTLRVLEIAHGTPSVDGTDGVLEEPFTRQALPALELAPDVFLEFDCHEYLMQPVQKEEVLCQVKIPTPAQPGHDVLGRELAVKTGITPKLSGGENTYVIGHQLVSKVDGIVYWDGTQFAVKRWKILSESVSSPTTNLKLKGDFYIRGDISGGASLETDGSLIIDGQILDATVTVGKNLLVRHGIHGGGQAVLKVGGQLQSPTIEEVRSAEISGHVFANEILKSTLSTDGDIFVLGGRGLVSGCNLTANTQICAKQVGETNTQTTLSVGLHGDLVEVVAQLKEQLEKHTDALDRLRKKIINMRAASSVLSQERREEFAQMQEERKRMESQEKDLRQKLQAARQTLAASLSGKVVCQTLCAPVTVRIGNYEETLMTSSKSCNIHIYLGSIVTR